MYRLKLFCLAALLPPLLLHAETEPESAIKQSIARAVTGSAADQDAVLQQLATSGVVTKTGRDLLTSWNKGEIYLYDDPSGILPGRAWRPAGNS
jgi:hypothetical protein